MSIVNTPLNAQVITVTGNEASGHSVVGDSLSAEIIVTATTGTSPSATFSIQWSNDGINFAPANPADIFPAIIAVGNVVMRFTSKGAFYRFAWVVTGTNPSLTTTIEVAN